MLVWQVFHDSAPAHPRRFVDRRNRPSPDGLQAGDTPAKAGQGVEHGTDWRLQELAGERKEPVQRSLSGDPGREGQLQHKKEGEKEKRRRRTRGWRKRKRGTGDDADRGLVAGMAGRSFGRPGLALAGRMLCNPHFSRPEPEGTKLKDVQPKKVELGPMPPNPRGGGGPSEGRIGACDAGEVFFFFPVQRAAGLGLVAETSPEPRHQTSHRQARSRARAPSDPSSSKRTAAKPGPTLSAPVFGGRRLGAPHEGPRSGGSAVAFTCHCGRGGRQGTVRPGTQRAGLRAVHRHLMHEFGPPNGAASLSSYRRHGSE